MTNETCPGCGVVLPRVDGPVHKYMESTPSCWAAFGEVLTREYSDATYMSVHRLTVDAYAVQHPGKPSPQSIQSVAVHLISLHSVLEQGLSTNAAMSLMQRCADAMSFTWLEPPASFGGLTVVDVLKADTATEHHAAVKRWAESTWQAWSPHHEQIALWAKQARTLAATNPADS
ncbi:MAG: DUF5946 family protein [Pseudomonadota bacterium]